MAEGARMILLFILGCAIVLLIALPAQVIGRLAHYVANRLRR
jgi:hypothetical protein